MNSNTKLTPKVSIIGGGNVGIRYAYALMIKGTARHIVIVDIDKKKVEGEIMDLSHGAPFTSPVKLTTGTYEDIKNSDLVVVTAGHKRQPGDSRLDLIKANVKLYDEIIPQTIDNAPDAIFLIVTNPVDVLSFYAYKLSNKPASKVIGSGTVLDSARFRNLLGKHCNIDPRNIHGYILGEHGASEFPVWSRVMIGGIMIRDYCTVCSNRKNCDHDNELDTIFKEVRDSGEKIIERKGETSYGIGLALVRITEAILNDENAILPVSCLVDGYLGIEDVYLSLPSIINKNGVEQVLKIKLDNEEKAALQNSAKIVKDAILEINS
ncbi:MAG: L-lactate dehydrogenase [Candidatus Hodarchaeota archaeon]